MASNSDSVPPPGETTATASSPEVRRGAGLWRQLAMLSVILVIAVAAQAVLVLKNRWLEISLTPVSGFSHSIPFRPELRGSAAAGSAVFALSALCCWRWGWAALHYLRAITYRYIYFPRLRRKASKIVAESGPVRELIVLATTYHERPWLTKKVFGSIMDEFATLTGLARPAVLIVVGGCDGDDQAVREIFDERLSALTPRDASMWPPELVLMRGDRGKRLAIASGLREVARRKPDPDGVVILMDGDSALGPGLLSRVMPIFRLPQRFAAVTTNEEAYVEGPTWFSEWISLRFGLRHLYMSSISLSHKVLCLTGRLSAFRADITTNPDFLEQVENDRLHHWLLGEYQMLSGDDKSTWFWLVSNGYPLLYVPDAMSVTYEVVPFSSPSPWTRALANMKRWSGNMLRNSGRSIALGPRTLGLFPWLCVLDQQISIWTVLIGPLSALLALAFGRFDFVAAYVLWVLASRTIRVMAAFRHGRRISVYYIPLQILSEWGGGLVKVWVWFHPVKQSWLNRGKRTLDSTEGSPFRALRGGLATYFCACAVLAFVFSLGLYTDLIPFLKEAPLAFQGLRSRAALPTASMHSELEGDSGVVYFGHPHHQPRRSD